MATLITTADGFQGLVRLLERSLSNDAAAEEELSRCVAYPDYAMGLLDVVATNSSKYENARQAASLHFKRLICQRWPKLDGDTDADQPPPLPSFERSMIKKKILDTFLKASPSIQVELAEALVVIAASDFPTDWSSVLPSISFYLATARSADDFLRINTLLGAARSIFLGLCQQQRDAMDYCNIDHCIKVFADILLDIILFANHGFQNPATATLPEVLECLRLCYQIIHSFNSIHLHDKFKPEIGQWMSSFSSILTSSYSTADGSLDLLRATVCDNLQLFTGNYEDVDAVSRHLKDSVTAVLDRLMSSPACVQLLVSGLKFITTVAESAHCVLLESRIQEIFGRVIMPNLQLRDEDVCLFTGNWIEYVRLDSEVSDADTPRRAACHLLGVLAINYGVQVVPLVSGMWQTYSAELANNWKLKDAIIYLVLSLGQILGGTVVDSLFTSVVEPELLRFPEQLYVPMLKATSLRFLTKFVDQISKDKVRVMLPHMVRFLNCDCSVVHSYAAVFIESLLNIDDAAFVPVVTTEIIQSLSGKLFLHKSYENPYLMKCLLHLLRSANVDVTTARNIFSSLVLTLEEMRTRPKDSEFNKYMFESLGALIIRFGDQMLHAHFLKLIGDILSDGILPFVPYTCKLFAWTVRFSNSLGHQDHATILDILLRSKAWHQPSSVAACLCLLRVLLPKGATQPNYLLVILRKFYDLLVEAEETAVGILNSIVEEVDYHVIEPYLETIWNCLFDRLARLQSVKEAAAKWAGSVISFMSIFIVRYGNTSLVDSIKAANDKGAKLTLFIRRFWTTTLKSIKDGRTVKMSAVASIILLRDNKYLHNNIALWTGLLDSSLVQIFRSDVQYKMDEDPLLKDKNLETLLGTLCAQFLALFPRRVSYIIDKVQLPHRDYLLGLLKNQTTRIP